MLGECSSPSPSPIQKKAKGFSRESARLIRDMQISESLPECTGHTRIQRLRCLWDASEGKQLSLLLAANPSLDGATFKELPNQRAKSDVNQAERPKVWLSKVTDYARGPLNEFNKPLGGQNVKYRERPSQALLRQGLLSKQSRIVPLLAHLGNAWSRNGSSGWFGTPSEPSFVFVFLMSTRSKQIFARWPLNGKKSSHR